MMHFLAFSPPASVFTVRPAGSATFAKLTVGVAIAGFGGFRVGRWRGVWAFAAKQNTASESTRLFRKEPWFFKIERPQRIAARSTEIENTAVDLVTSSFK